MFYLELEKKFYVPITSMRRKVYVGSYFFLISLFESLTKMCAEKAVHGHFCSFKITILGNPLRCAIGHETCLKHRTMKP